MNTEEIAVVLQDLGYQPLLETIKAIDPDLYKVIEALTLVKNNGYGAVSVEIYNKKITLISPTLKIHLGKDK